MINNKKKYPSPSTVSRMRKISSIKENNSQFYEDNFVKLYNADVLEVYDNWENPTVIISDGAYGLLGFDGDTSKHLELPDWYEPHIKKWSEKATNETTLWFFNSEIGWATIHPILEKFGWRYINANIWNKGMAHVAGKVNTKTIRRFPVVTEICVQYVFEKRIDGKTMQEWLLYEWERTGLPLREANVACGVKDAATRKYFDQGHLWYFPPAKRFNMLVEYANKNGSPEGKPYYSVDGVTPLTFEEISKLRAKFHAPHGVTNVWDRPPLNGSERIKNPDTGKSAHLNQKPLDIMCLIIEASSDTNDVIWEPFGGLFSGSVAAKSLARKAFSAEIDQGYFQLGVERFKTENNFVQLDLLN
ncbi:DNA methyltransferase [Facklamia languida]